MPDLFSKKYLLVYLAAGISIYFLFSQGFLKGFASQEILPTSPCNGVTDISLNQVNYYSNDLSLGGKWWQASVVQNCQGQSLVGGTGSAPLQSQDGTKSVSPLKVTFTLNSETENYPITAFYQIQQINYYFINNVFDASVDNCRNLNDPRLTNANSARFIGQNSLFGVVSGWCVYFSDKGTQGSIPNTPNVEFDSTVTVSTAGQSDQHIKLSGLKGISGKNQISDLGKAYANWVGDVSSGLGFPDTTQITAYYDGSLGQWRLINRYDFQSQEINVKSCLRFSEINPTMSETELTNCINPYNSAVSNALLSTSNVPITFRNAVVKDSTPNSGTATIDVTQQPVYYPLLVLKISADWLGVYQPVSQPRIISVDYSPKPFSSSGTVFVDVRNDGGDGVVSATVSCSNYISSTGTTPQTIQSGQSVRFNIGISGAISTTTSASCTATIQDVQNPDNKDTRQFTINLVPIPQCDVVGGTRCSIDGNSIEVCTSDRLWKFKETCTYDCTSNVCKGPSDGGGDDGGGDGGTKICTNGAVNYPVCNVCPEGYHTEGGVLGLGGICKQNTPPGPWNYIVIGVTGLLIFLVAGASSLRDKDWVGIAIAGVLAVIGVLVITYIIENATTIILGLGLAGLFGGVILYFFGGAIITILAVIAIIIKRFRD